jgi:hypothetical protein
MSLIKIESGVEYIDVVYPERVMSIRQDQTKELKYDVEDHVVILVLRNGTTIELNYKEVEDPGNPGYPYSSGSLLYTFIAALHGITSTSGVDVTMSMVGTGSTLPPAGVHLVRVGDIITLTAYGGVFNRFEITSTSGIAIINYSPYELLNVEETNVLAVFD